MAAARESFTNMVHICFRAATTIVMGLSFPTERSVRQHAKVREWAKLSSAVSMNVTTAVSRQNSIFDKHDDRPT